MSRTTYYFIRSIQYSPLTDRVVGADVLNDSTKILLQSLLWETVVSNSAMGRNMHSAYGQGMGLKSLIRQCFMQLSANEHLRGDFINRYVPSFSMVRGEGWERRGGGGRY